MDETAMKIGLLMEAAQAHHKAAETSLKKLKATTNDLNGIVRDEVRRVVMEEFQALATDSKRASDALYEVQRAANVRAFGGMERGNSGYGLHMHSAGPDLRTRARDEFFAYARRITGRGKAAHSVRFRA